MLITYKPSSLVGLLLSCGSGADRQPELEVYGPYFHIMCFIYNSILLYLTQISEIDSPIRSDWNFVCGRDFVTYAVYFVYFVLVSLSTRYYPMQSAMCDTHESITKHFLT
jgi:hypothetical protein